MRPGYELALAAALGGRLDAALVRDMDGANTLLDGAGPDGATALLAGEAASEAVKDEQIGQAKQRRRAIPPRPARKIIAAASGDAPAPGALRLIELVSGPVR